MPYQEYVAATAHGDSDTPRLAVKQYIPLDNPTPKPGDVTIIGAHANGFPKELYEPLWEEIHRRTSQAGFRIRSIFIADIWNQGQSGVLNEKILGNDRCELVRPRERPDESHQPKARLYPTPDCGHWPQHGRHSVIALVPCPSTLAHIPCASRPRHPGTKRQHCPCDGVHAASRCLAVNGCRRDTIQGSKFFQSWDPRVLDRWIEYGLRQAPTELYPAEGAAAKDERVTLTTSKHQELFTFLRPTYRGVPGEEYLDKDPAADEEYPGYPFYRPEPLHVFQRLPELRPSTLYVFGDKSDLSPPAQRQAKMARTGTGVGGSGGTGAGRVKEVVLDCGHLVAMEKVTECADAITAFLGDEMARWRRNKADFEKYWNKKSRTEQITIDGEWANKVRPNDTSAGTTKL
ncbi:hypothetical protein ACCO45_003806 [Purpureocillium lilacinum]|uniref:Uncharacterized protein n=1 Tax=Purpureocillium lilacinum TaxID=33203 RepID=A0ACC4E232_PURLI